jgi:signal transduction histidine kinase
VLTLLQNAVRFSPDGSEIEIDVSVDEEEGRLEMVIRDHGPGVPPEHREKIFEPFFTTAVDGLGMGLFVASRIADLQHIGLSLEESGSNGASFRVSFKIAGRADMGVCATM